MNLYLLLHLALELFLHLLHPDLHLGPEVFLSWLGLGLLLLVACGVG